MKVIIEIPDKDIPKQQDTMSVNFIFTAGCPCQCDYPFDVIKESDDCVSRQAAIVALDNRMSSLENVDMQIAMGFAKGIIYDLPLVTPVEKVGQWIFVHPLQEDDGGGYMCSICNVGDWNLSGKENYCPNCGAKMQEVKE